MHSTTEPITHPASFLEWQETGATCRARWISETRPTPPPRVLACDDTLGADKAYRLACEGTALLWRGDFHNARQLLQALQRRLDRRPVKPPAVGADPAAVFHAHRMAQSQRARILGMLLIPLEAGARIPLRRAPDIAAAWQAAHGTLKEPAVIALRELLGLIGAAEWQRKGVDVPALGARIHPGYGVFSPVRGEYVDLVAQAPLPDPPPSLAFDIGTGSGVLAVTLARRGIARIVATDTDARAIACAGDNIARLGLVDRVDLLSVDLFPPGRAPLIVCNPPWLPAKPTSSLERAVYDPESRMLRGFLDGLSAHLAPGGEAWLILSDLAEHLGLRSRDTLFGYFESAGLRVLGRLDTRPRHSRAQDASDPLHAARSREITSLWRLAAI